MTHLSDTVLMNNRFASWKPCSACTRAEELRKEIEKRWGRLDYENAKLEESKLL